MTLNGTKLTLSGREDGEILEKETINGLPADQIQELTILLG